MQETTAPIRVPSRRMPFGAVLLLLAAAMAGGCLRDDGVVDPLDTRNKAVLAHFQGVAIRDTDSDFDSDRLLDFPKPRIALVWEFFGSKVQGSAFGNTEVSVTSPIRFSIDMTGPPPPEVANSTEPVLGHFWLYSDRNGNNTFDRLQHPKLVEDAGAIDAVRDRWVKEEKLLAEVSQVLAEPRFRVDTFYVGKEGAFLHLRNGKLDTLYAGGGPSDSTMWNEVKFRRFRILRGYNSWENFFALRKKTHMVTEIYDPVEGYVKRLIMRNWELVVPVPGKEEVFEERLQAATMSYMYRFYMLSESLKNAQKTRMDDWPYNVDTVPGHDPKDDWLAGRGRWYHVAYFPDGVSLETAIQAEQGGSSFQVKNRDKLHRGYNVMYCDDQYRCEVLGPEDEIVVDLGQTEEYFNPPISPVTLPIKDFTQKRSPEKELVRFEGTWGFMPYSAEESQIATAVVDGVLWMDVPRRGLLRLVQADSLTFFLPGREVQVEFVLDPKGEAYKLLLYEGKEGKIRSACAREAPLGRISIRERAEQALAREPRPLSDSLEPVLGRSFLRGTDTLTVSRGGGDTLMVRHARLVPQPFLADGAAAHGIHTGDRLSLLRNEKGTVTGMFLVEGGQGRILPALDYSPRLAKDLFPAPAAPESLVSSDGGSAKDVYVGFGGKKRYGCAADGTYLKAGDGWVQALRKGQTGDDLSLRWNGDGITLRLQGLEGRRARVVLHACRDKGDAGMGRRFLISARGFRSGTSGPGDLLEDDRLVEVSPTGDSLSFGPFPVPSGAYDVELRREATLDSAFYFALDGYKVYAE